MSVAISTITLERGDRKRLEDSLYSLTKLGIPVVAVDGGSSESFINSMRKMGIQVFHSTGLGYQLKNSLWRASGLADYVLYTEPDKKEWIERKLLESLEAYSDSGLDVGLIGRTPESMATFSPSHQFAENLFNSIIQQYTGNQGDSAYGPRIMPSSHVKEIESLNKDIGWGSLSYLLARAFRSGLKVGTIYTAVECPPSERTDQRAYRLFQLSQLCLGFSMGLEDKG